MNTTPNHLLGNLKVILIGFLGRQAVVCNVVNQRNGESEESDIPARKKKPASIKPQASGPSETRVSTQKTKSKHPSRRLPPVPSNGEGDNTDDIPPVKLEPTVHQ